MQTLLVQIAVALAMLVVHVMHAAVQRVALVFDAQVLSLQRWYEVLHATAQLPPEQETVPLVGAVHEVHEAPQREASVSP